MLTNVFVAVSPARAAAVLERNLKAGRKGNLTWVHLLSGLLEPLFYLLSIGVGVGRLVDRGIPYGDGTVPYPQYVAPAMLTVSAVSGAIAASTFGFFAKLRYAKTFEVILATPVRSFEIALAELVWAMLRGLLFSATFLVIMVAAGFTGPGEAALALLATGLVGLSFAAVGMGVSTLVRGWQDFDTVAAAQTALFLFSGTFVPVDRYPVAFRSLVELTPLYHAVELVRGLCLDDFRWALLGHTAYLLAMLALGLTFAHRRMEKTLRG